MATFEERIYSLGVDALAEQERRVAELQSRASVLLAAAAVRAIASDEGDLSRARPHGIVEVSAAGVGLVGAAGVLVFVVLLLRPYELGFAVRAGATYREPWTDDLIDQPAVDVALAEMFEQRRNRNTKTVRRLERLLGLALASLVIDRWTGVGRALAS
jgi:hypothetical protein